MMPTAINRSTILSFKLNNRLLQNFLVFVLSVFIMAGCGNSAKVINQTASVKVVTVEGKVHSEEDGDAVSDAKVWVEGTTITASTNASGQYKIRVPRGYYKVLVSSNGYYEQTKSLDLDVEVNSVEEFNFALKTKLNLGSYVSQNREKADDTPVFETKEMKRIWVLEEQVDSLQKIIDNKGEVGDSGNENGISANSEIQEDSILDRFIEQYINDDLSCEVANPNDIRFYSNAEEGVIRLDRPVKIIVNNYDLGYVVTVDLEKYISKQYSEILGVTIDADYYYKEMEPKNAREQKRWDRNRKEMFEGSMRHFLIAMASEQSPLFFGYRLYNGQFVNSTSVMAYSNSTVSDVEADKNGVIYPNLFTGNSTMKFEGELRVEYIKRGVEDPDGIMGLDMYKHQTAWLSLNAPGAEFTQNGLLKNPDKVEVKGVWRYQPVCKMLPSDYLPEIKNES